MDWEVSGGDDGGCGDVSKRSGGDGAGRGWMGGGRRLKKEYIEQ